MSQLEKFKKLIGKRKYDPFDCFVDGFVSEDATRITVFLTKVINGELRCITGNITIFHHELICGEFVTTIHKQPLVQFQVQGITDTKACVAFVDKALQKCIEKTI